MATDNISISVIVHLPYRYGKASELLAAARKIEALKETKKLARAKLRIREDKAVSTLAAYESVYQFCPNESLIVTSRHNVEFEKGFAKEVLAQVS